MSDGRQGADGYGDAVDAHPLARHQTSAPAVVAGGDAAAIKQLYVDLGRDWSEYYESNGDDIPVLSAPETLPVVVGCMARVAGRVLDAGCGPNPSVSIALASDERRSVVSLDIGLGTVRVACLQAARHGVTVVGVVGDVERLPFRSCAFDGVVCDDTLEHLPDDASGAAELARVTRTGGTIVIATPNRRSAVIMRAKLVDRFRRRRRDTKDYFVSTSHLREYTWAELDALVRPILEPMGRATVGWERMRWVNRLLRLPGLWRLSQMIVIEGRPR